MVIQLSNMEEEGVGNPNSPNMSGEGVGVGKQQLNTIHVTSQHSI